MRVREEEGTCFSPGCMAERETQMSKSVVEPSAAPVAISLPLSSTRNECNGMSVTCYECNGMSVTCYHMRGRVRVLGGVGATVGCGRRGVGCGDGIQGCLGTWDGIAGCGVQRLDGMLGVN